MSVSTDTSKRIEAMWNRHFPGVMECVRVMEREKSTGTCAEYVTFRDSFSSNASIRNLSHEIGPYLVIRDRSVSPDSVRKDLLGSFGVV